MHFRGRLNKYKSNYISHINKEEENWVRIKKAEI